MRPAPRISGGRRSGFVRAASVCGVAWACGFGGPFGAAAEPPAQPAAEAGQVIRIVADVVKGVIQEVAGPPDVAADAQMQQQLKQQINHWDQQFTRVLYGELDLIRSVCGDLPKESRRKIAAAGEQAAKEAAVRLAERQLGRRLNRAKEQDAKRRPAGKEAARAAGGQPARPTDPLAAISTALAEAVATHAGDKQAAAYAAEVAARNDRRKKAVAGEVVALLDADLFLSATQRAAITAALVEHGGDALVLAVQGVHIVNGRRVYPGVPTSQVLPHLTDVQKRRLAPQGADPNAAAMGVETSHAWINFFMGDIQPVARDPWWFQ